jgi:hypothetical protein
MGSGASPLGEVHSEAYRRSSERLSYCPLVPIIVLVQRRTSRLVLASSVIVAGFIAIVAREDRPAAVYLVTYGVVAVALVSLGLFGRGRALPVFAGTYALGCVLWRSLWWTDTPDLTGIDDISPIGRFIITMPTVLVLIAAGWAIGAVARWASASLAGLRATRR